MKLLVDLISQFFLLAVTRLFALQNMLGFGALRFEQCLLLFLRLLFLLISGSSRRGSRRFQAQSYILQVIGSNIWQFIAEMQVDKVVQTLIQCAAQSFIT